MNTLPSLKQLVSGGQSAHFVRFRQGHLWYATQDGFEFPVPVSDVGEATFHATEKALLLMRYIRKHLEVLGASQEQSFEPSFRPQPSRLHEMPIC